VLSGLSGRFRWRIQRQMRMRQGVSDGTLSISTGTISGSPPLVSRVVDERPYPWLSDEEILERMSRASARLREGGEISAADVPMCRATDAELDRRIAMAEQALNGDIGDVSFGMDPELVDELLLLDYLIENPESSIPPLWSHASVPVLWDDKRAFEEHFGPGSAVSVEPISSWQPPPGTFAD
jgi:hypothetical protein